MRRDWKEIAVKWRSQNSKREHDPGTGIQALAHRFLARSRASRTLSCTARSSTLQGTETIAINFRDAWSMCRAYAREELPQVAMSAFHSGQADLCRETARAEVEGCTISFGATKVTGGHELLLDMHRMLYILSRPTNRSQVEPHQYGHSDIHGRTQASENGYGSSNPRQNRNRSYSLRSGSCGHCWEG